MSAGGAVKLENVAGVYAIAVEVGLIEERIWQHLIDQLAGATDYHGDVKTRFDSLLLRLVRFLRASMDELNVRRRYLGPFEDGKPWPESDLQKDLLLSLQGCGYANAEQTAAAGRSDIYVPQPGFRFVIEVKRSLVWSDAAIEPFLAQASAYEQTDVRLGVLAVLDLSSRKSGDPHIESCMSIRNVSYSSGDTRTVVVMRVPGNRKTPSQQ